MPVNRTATVKIAWPQIGWLAPEPQPIRQNETSDHRVDQERRIGGRKQSQAEECLTFLAEQRSQLLSHIPHILQRLASQHRGRGPHDHQRDQGHDDGADARVQQPVPQLLDVPALLLDQVGLKIRRRNDKGGADQSQHRQVRQHAAARHETGQQFAGRAAGPATGRIRGSTQTKRASGRRTASSTARGPCRGS